jgi:hypothetical protein
VRWCRCRSCTAATCSRDGNNPTFLQGYGAYGISTNPALVPAHFAYFDRGFVRAFCHVRGGGEKGEAWYRAGYQATKANTWKDFIACADYLVREKYTSPSRPGHLRRQRRRHPDRQCAGRTPRPVRRGDAAGGRAGFGGRRTA